MKFEINRKDFLKALDEASKASDNNSAIPFMREVLLESVSNSIKLTCNNLEFAIQMTLPAQILEPGKILVDVFNMRKMLRKLSGQSVALADTVQEEIINIIIICETSSFTVVGTDPSLFPEVPVPVDGSRFGINQRTLRSMIAQSLHAIATEDTRTIHTGVLFDLKDQKLNIVALDGYRMALRRETIITEYKSSFVIPGTCATSLAKMLNPTCDEIASITQNGKHICFDLGNSVVCSRLLEGEFLDYESATPKSSDTYVIVSVKDMVLALQRAKEMYCGTKVSRPVLEVLFTDKKIKLSAKTHMGLYQENIKCNGNKKLHMRMGFQVLNILDTFKALDCESVKMELSSEFAPLKIVPVNNDQSFMMLVLPFHLPDTNVA